MVGSSLKRMAWSHCSTRRENNGVSATLSVLDSQQYCIRAGQSRFNGSGFLLDNGRDPAGQTALYLRELKQIHCAATQFGFNRIRIKDAKT